MTEQEHTEIICVFEVFVTLFCGIESKIKLIGLVKGNMDLLKPNVFNLQALFCKPIMPIRPPRT